MDAVFEKVLEVSLSAGVLVAVIAIARLFLRKAPKWILCLMWALVAVRLIFPVSLETQLSLMPDTEPVTQQILSAQPDLPIYTIVDPGTPVVPDAVPAAPVFRFWMAWVAGFIGMCIYALCSYFAVRRRVAVSKHTGDNVWLCDYIDTPFILGVFCPRIYLPSSLSPDSTAHVLAHEQAHLQRRDHWWKPLGFLLLSVHWFNPLIWLAYILLCRDIELACDEKVVSKLDAQEKKAYSAALLSGSVKRPVITACPLAFGEVGIKARGKSVLNYKKPAFWIIVTAVVLTAVLAVCFLTTRPEDPEPTTPDTTLTTEPTTQFTEPTINLFSEAGQLKGMVISQTGTYIKVRVDGVDSVTMVQVNIGNFPNLPQLYPGDIVSVEYNPLCRSRAAGQCDRCPAGGAGRLGYSA